MQRTYLGIVDTQTFILFRDAALRLCPKNVTITQSEDLRVYVSSPDVGSRRYVAGLFKGIEIGSNAFYLGIVD